MEIQVNIPANFNVEIVLLFFAKIMIFLVPAECRHHCLSSRIVNFERRSENTNDIRHYTVSNSYKLYYLEISTLSRFRRI